MLLFAFFFLDHCHSYDLHRPFSSLSSMTSLLSSFIIDPFVRQARRFSLVNNEAPHRVPGSPQQATSIPKKQRSVGESHASNVRHTQSKFTASSPHDGRREAKVVEIHTDVNTCLVTTSSSRYSTGGDGAVDSGLSSRETSVTEKASNPVTPGGDSDEALVPAGSATYGSNTDQAIVSINTNPITMADDMVANRSHSNSGRDMPPTRLRLQDTNMSRPVMPDRAKMSSSLPADDGMRLLRERIHGIRSDSVSQDEKARKMHDLMTEEWKNAQLNLRPQSPGSQISQDRPFDPASPRSTLCSPTSPSTTSAVPVDPQNPFNIRPEDLQPTYRPIPDPEPIADDGHADESPTELPEPVLGCKHYQRNVKIQCFDCKTWHTCRHCHDAAVHSHHLNRRATENMLCMHCFTPQAAGQYCKNCNERAAWYYCDICKLWDDDGSKRIYHCADCGICRKGEGLGKDYVHCKVSCGCAYDLLRAKLMLNGRDVMSAYPYLIFPRTPVSKTPPNPTVHFVWTTCSLRPSKLWLCLAAITYTITVTPLSCSQHTNVQYANVQL